MQTGDVIAPPGDLDEATSLAELVSVFLSPDVDRDLSGVALSEREAEQRLDGVVRFGDELVAVIESKIVGKAPSQQSSELRLRGAQVTHSRVEPLGWHDLLQSWWRLIERGLLAPAERLLIQDLVTFVEEHFPHLLPFSTLIEAGDHPLRRQRRLMALLRNATGLEEIRPRTTGGAEAMLDAALGTRCVQRLMLDRDGDELVLATAAGELKPQALAFYGSDRASRVVALAERDGWDATRASTSATAARKRRPNGCIRPSVSRSASTCAVGLRRTANASGPTDKTRSEPSCGLGSKTAGAQARRTPSTSMRSSTGSAVGMPTSDPGWRSHGAGHGPTRRAIADR